MALHVSMHGLIKSSKAWTPLALPAFPFPELAGHISKGGIYAITLVQAHEHAHARNWAMRPRLDLEQEGAQTFRFTHFADSGCHRLQMQALRVPKIQCMMHWTMLYGDAKLHWHLDDRAARLQMCWHRLSKGWTFCGIEEVNIQHQD